MSSTRVAVASCALAVLLAAGSVAVVRAFPLYATADESRQAPLPPRHAQTPEYHHKTAVAYWNKAANDAALSAAEKLDLIQRGIAAEDRALTIDPAYAPALAYKAIFLRMRAGLTSDAAARAEMLGTADALRLKVEADTLIQQNAAARAARAAAAPPAVAASVAEEAFAREAQTLQAVRVGGAVRAPAKIRDLKPVYPAEAKASRVTGVVIAEILISPGGEVTEARILRSIPLLDDAAVEAVRQWRFMPTLVDGEPRSVIMTVPVNFLLQ